MKRTLLYQSVLFAFALAPLHAQRAPQPDPPLKNWAAPLYWAPHAGELDHQRQAAAARDGSAQAQSSPEIQTAPLTFIAMTPCRLVDTRPASQSGTIFPAGFGPPSLVGDAGVSRTFALQKFVPVGGQDPASACTGPLPPEALAYSFSVFAVNAAGFGFLTVFPTGTTPPNASTLLFNVNNTVVNAVNTASVVAAGSNGSIDVTANVRTDVIIDINGYYVAAAAGNAGGGGGGGGGATCCVTGSTGAIVSTTEAHFSDPTYTDPIVGFPASIKVAQAPGGFAIAAGGNSLITGILGVGALLPARATFTTAPLTINAPSSGKQVPQLNLINNGGGAGAGTAIEFYTYTDQGNGAAGARIGSIDDGAFSGHLLFMTKQQSANGSLVERMRIGSTGNIGIGTASPAARLHISGPNDSAVSGTPLLRLTDTNLNDFFSIDNGNNQSDFRLFSLAHNIEIQVDGNANQTVFTATGSVGIGTATPRDKLEVSGELRVANCVRNAAGTQIAGTCPSDERLKTNIAPFSPMLDKLVQLQPVHFDWRADEYPDYHFGTERSYGLLAQQVEQVLPELVTEDKKGFKSVNYSELPLVLLQAVRDLNAENRSVREENRKLEARLAALEALIAKSTAAAGQ